ncbi:hypothetical protein HK096_010166, partial [Nowakowskiella sp. JEL0078]
MSCTEVFISFLTAVLMFSRSRYFDPVQNNGSCLLTSSNISNKVKTISEFTLANVTLNSLPLNEAGKKALNIVPGGIPNVDSVEKCRNESRKFTDFFFFEYTQSTSICEPNRLASAPNTFICFNGGSGGNITSLNFTHPLDSQTTSTTSLIPTSSNTATILSSDSLTLEGLAPETITFIVSLIVIVLVVVALFIRKIWLYCFSRPKTGVPNNNNVNPLLAESNGTDTIEQHIQQPQVSIVISQLTEGVEVGYKPLPVESGQFTSNSRTLKSSESGLFVRSDNEVVDAADLETSNLVSDSGESSGHVNRISVVSGDTIISDAPEVLTHLEEGKKIVPPIRSSSLEERAISPIEHQLLKTPSHFFVPPPVFPPRGYRGKYGGTT